MANKLHRLLKSGRIHTEPSFHYHAAPRCYPFPASAFITSPRRRSRPTQYKRIPEAELQRGSGAVKEGGGVNFHREKRLRSVG